MTYTPSALIEEAAGMLEWMAVAGYQGPDTPYKLEAAQMLRQGQKPEGRALEVAINFFKDQANIYFNGRLCQRRAVALRQSHRARGERLYRLLARLEANG